MSDPLIEAIDNAAIDLLSRVKTDDTVAADETVSVEVRRERRELLMEQVKGFAEVAKWAEIRKRINPPPAPEKEPSKYGRLVEQFNGDAVVGGGGSARKTKAAGRAGGSRTDGDRDASAGTSGADSGRAANGADPEVTLDDL